jgi:5-methyltetrahydropteroyltriglutamate--homocysteine methyltransferase
LRDGLETTVVGSLPLVPNGDALMRSFYQQENGFKDTIVKAVSTQVKAGIDIISDGQTRADMIKLFASKIRGIRLKGKPIIINDLGFEGPITLDDQLAVRKILDSDPTTKEVGIKGIVTGPFTMTLSSVDEFYNDKQDATFAFAKVLNEEARALEPVVDMLQFDEPFFSQEFPEYAKEAISIAREGIKKPVALHACGDVKDIFPQLVEFDVDILDHEFKANPDLVPLASDLSFTQRLGFGSVRSDSDVVESVDEVTAFISDAVERFGPERLLIEPDCGMAPLPFEIAKTKLENLVKARDLVRSGF